MGWRRAAQRRRPGLPGFKKVKTAELRRARLDLMTNGSRMLEQSRPLIDAKAYESKLAEAADRPRPPN